MEQRYNFVDGYIQRYPHPSKRSLLTRRAIALVISLVLLGLAYVHIIEPLWVEVETIEITLPHLPSEFHNYRIAQLSDLHLDNRISEQRLNQAVRRINALHPDLVALTGDFITERPNIYAPKLSHPLSQLTPTDGTVAVLGNHDQTLRPSKRTQLVVDALQRGRVMTLQNDVRILRRGDAVLSVGGVDDVWFGYDRLDLVLEKLPPTGAAILLAHEPDFADVSAATHRFDLQLSGHSHGGQIRVPFKGAPVLPPLAQKYPMGQYYVEEMIQYTNRGLGTVRPRVRFNCRPEITLLILKAAS